MKTNEMCECGHIKARHQLYAEKDIKLSIKKILERIDNLDWKMLSNEVFKFKIKEIIKSEFGDDLTK